MSASPLQRMSIIVKQEGPQQMLSGLRLRSFEEWCVYLACIEGVRAGVRQMASQPASQTYLSAVKVCSMRACAADLKKRSV
jgi:hypothetical protein